MNPRGRWWVEGLKSSEGDDAIFPWQDKYLVTAKIRFESSDLTMNWALEKGWIVAQIAHWCRDNCKSMWRIADLDHVYFGDHSEAMLFLMSWSESKSYELRQ